MVNVHNWGSFLRIGRAVSAVSHLRHRAWCRIQEHLRWRESTEISDSLDNILRRVVVLASSSRGGTSVTAELLQWQGADCKNPMGRMFTLPGEEKPFLILSGLAFPTRREMFDDLDASNATESSVEALLSEVRSEVGYPTANCADLHLYSIQLYRRLLLQWPLEMIELDQSAAIRKLTENLLRAFGEEYCDSVQDRRRVLACCIASFPFIRPSFYDCSPIKQNGDVWLLKNGAWSLEEPPFILPPPWRNAPALELSQGTLLLRDPSNAWRLGFWKAVFRAQEMSILHLVRDARESIQGLCDGWNYAFGFQTLPSNAPLRIAGYAPDTLADDPDWKQYRLNFSVDRQLSSKLLEERQPMTLVEVSAHQWRAAHEKILSDSNEFSLNRVPLSFEALRADPVGVFISACMAGDLEVSGSGVAYARSFKSHWVMATVGPFGAMCNRWRSSPYSSEIRAIVGQPGFRFLSERLISMSLAGDGIRGSQIAGRKSRPVFICESA